MAKENEVDEDLGDEPEDTDSTDWKAEATKLREKAVRQREKTKTLRDSLKEREAKIAEFEKQALSRVETKPDEKLLKKLNSALMRSYGYTDTDEVALVEKWQTDTGKDVEELHTHPTLSKILKTEIEELRTTKANDAATKNLEGGSGGKGAQKDPSHYIQKNELPSTREEREKLIKMQVEKESGSKM